VLARIFDFFSSGSSKRRDPRTVAPRATETTRKKVTHIRRSPGSADAPRTTLPAEKLVIDELSKCPKFVKVLTRSGGEVEIAKQMQSHIAILDLGSGHMLAMATPTHIDGTYLLTQIARAETLGYRLLRKAETTVNFLTEIYGTAAEIGTQIQDVRESSSKSNLIYLFEEIITHAVEAKASDVHFCPRFDSLDKTGAILFRVDGLLRIYRKMSAAQMRSMLNSAYANTEITEKDSRSETSFNERMNQKCSMSVAVNDRPIDLRYQHEVVKGGFDAVIRILGGTGMTQALTLQELGFAPYHGNQLSLGMRKQRGAIFIAGVTGSGKTTTMMHIITMDKRTLREKKTYTIEDPPEYDFAMYGISQVPVRSSNFAAAAKDLLRMDPDRVMVGEVRDRDTGAVIRAMIQSGHQVLGSVHATSPLGIIERLNSEEIGLSRHTLTSPEFINMLIFQHLIPKVCERCRQPAQKVLGKDYADQMKRFGLNIETMYVRQEEGDCPACGGSGTTGQSLAAAVVRPDREMLLMLRDGRDWDAEEYWRRQRVAPFDNEDCRGKTAFEHALYKMSKGVFDPRDVEGAFVPFEDYSFAEMGA